MDYETEVLTHRLFLVTVTVEATRLGLGLLSILLEDVLFLVEVVYLYSLSKVIFPVYLPSLSIVGRRGR